VCVVNRTSERCATSMLHRETVLRPNTSDGECLSRGRFPARADRTPAAQNTPPFHEMAGFFYKSVIIKIWIPLEVATTKIYLTLMNINISRTIIINHRPHRLFAAYF